jgi:glycosyltransferase involved in cell wall biosynthesis
VLRIGIYSGDVSPTTGGAYTLLNTIHEEIRSSYSCEVYFFFENSKNSQKRFVKNNVTYINLYNDNILQKIKRKILKICRLYKEDTYFDTILHRENIDLLWILRPYELNITIPYVFTVWDLGHRILPYFPEMNLGNREWSHREQLYKSMLYRAAYIITGNETGKKEILANYPVSPDKIKIIPFPLSGFCFQNIQPEKPNKIKQPFVFYPAQFWAHKNHVAIVEAIAWLRDMKDVTINCYFVGSDHGNQRYIENIIKKYHLENQIFVLGFVPLPELIWLYKNALAMVYVSLLGPNNLPPLEAVALGCPLILSNIPGHLEQMRDVCLAVDATNSTNIGEAVLSLYKDSEIRNNLILSGLTFAKKFRNYSYFQQMLQVVDLYSLYRKNWK